ncbi:unnamed protein product [Choristocarpus tenellus]
MTLITMSSLALLLVSHAIAFVPLTPSLPRSHDKVHEVRKLCANSCAKWSIQGLWSSMSDANSADHQDKVVEVMIRPVLKVIGRAGPPNEPPVYEDTRLLDRTLLGFFRAKLAEEIGGDTFSEGYDGLMEMIRALNEKYPTKRATQEASRRVLKSLFPSWLPGQFAVMFSQPFPEFSSKLNAWVTLVASQWLMGVSEVNDVEVRLKRVADFGHSSLGTQHAKCFGNLYNWNRPILFQLPLALVSCNMHSCLMIDGGGIGVRQGLLVERCRFLEASECASVCMNTCKVPTEEFFMKDMGLPLEMTPNYEDFSCQFSFGKTPLPRENDEAFEVTCFEQCPSKGALRGKAARCHQIEVEGAA